MIDTVTASRIAKAFLGNDAYSVLDTKHVSREEFSEAVGPRQSGKYIVSLWLRVLDIDGQEPCPPNEVRKVIVDDETGDAYLFEQL